MYARQLIFLRPLIPYTSTHSIRIKSIFAATGPEIQFRFPFFHGFHYILPATICAADFPTGNRWGLVINADSIEKSGEHVSRAISHQICEYGNRCDNLVHPFSATNWKAKSLERWKPVGMVNIMF